MNARKIYSANLSELRTIHEWIRSQLILCDLDETGIRKMELATEEALVNVIVHGYKGAAGKLEIAVRMSDGKKVEVEIADWALPFNPLEKEIHFDPFASLEDRKVGGLGILMIRQYVDDIHYRREGDRNILTLFKSI